MPPRSSSARRSAIFAAASVAMAGANSFAAVSSTGDVSPSDPTTWTVSTAVIVGNTSNGTVGVDSGSMLNSSSAVLGQSTAPTGR